MTIWIGSRGLPRGMNGGLFCEMWGDTRAELFEFLAAHGMQHRNLIHGRQTVKLVPVKDRAKMIEKGAKLLWQ